MGLRRRLGIYVGYDFPSIVKYLEPITRDVFIACFVYSHFNESIFPTLRREKEKQLVKGIIME